MNLLYNGISLTHLLNPGGKHQSHHCGESLRDHCHCKRYRNHQCLDHGRPVDKDLADKHQNAEYHARDPQYQGNAVQVLLKRGFLLGDLMEHAGDLTDLCVISDLLHNSLAAAVFHKGGHKYLILAVSQRGLLITLCIAVLLHCHALSGQRRFIYLKRAVLHKCQIRGYHTPRLQDHIISHHQIRRGDLLLRAVPEHHRSGGIDLLQRLHGLFRRDLLHRTDDHICQHHYQNDNAIHQLTRGDGDHCRRDEQDQKGRCELPQNDG